ncbi:MAG: integrase [Segetibacter sp.]|nr:integrase [Segetibacter sp.]
MLFTRYPQINSFIEYLKFEKRFSQHTIVSYETDLKQFCSFLISQFDGPAITEIAPAFVRSWLAEMRGDEMTGKTLNRKISSLKSFYKYLMKMGEVTQSPMTTIVAPKIAKRLPTFVAEKDIAILQNNVAFGDDWKGKTNKLVIDVLYATGMRLTELINLKESHIDPSNNQIKVLGKGNKERIIPVSRDLLKTIGLYRDEKKLLGLEPGEFLFVNEKGKQLYPKYVYNLVKQNLSLVTTINKKSPHVLRHTFATHLTNNGADLNAVKELLGHSSLAATQVYTHNTIDKLKEIYKKAHPKG